MNLDELLKGKTITRVEAKGCDNGFSIPIHQEKDIFCDSGDIEIHFSDGSFITCWNSEWGGITLGKRF